MCLPACLLNTYLRFVHVFAYWLVVGLIITVVSTFWHFSLAAMQHWHPLQKMKNYVIHSVLCDMGLLTPEVFTFLKMP